MKKLRSRPHKLTLALLAVPVVLALVLALDSSGKPPKVVLTAGWDLAKVLGAYPNNISLDDLTRGRETMNHVDLLHLGKNSRPMRLKLLREAKSHVFITVPYWFDDKSGNEFLEAVRSKKKLFPGLDFRVLVDWVSPASSDDFWASKQYKRVKKVADGHLREWNQLWDFRSWSAKFWTNRMHDKLLAVDGKYLVMGGMNVADEYLQGGDTVKGWHDTDILIEGPAAQDGEKFFLKPYLLQAYLDKRSNPFPSEDNFQLGALQAIFYNDVSDYSYEGGDETIHLLLKDFLSSKRYFPPVPWKPGYDSPVRLIWDSPLVDRIPESWEHRSKFFNTLDFIAPAIEKSVKIFMPYPTFSRRFRRYLVGLAKRGIKVQIITNSIDSHDLGIVPYLGGLVNYEPLMKAGVEIHEWQGHKNLLEFGKANGCEPKEWPGRTLHTKAMILDDSVAIVGSHNMNYRSEFMNSEVMALIRDRDMAKRLDDVFQYDLQDEFNTPEDRRLKCGNLILKNRPPKTHRVTMDDFRKLVKRYGVTAAFLDRVKWAL